MKEKGLSAIAVIVVVVVLVAGLFLYKMRRKFLPAVSTTGTVQEQPVSLGSTSTTNEQLSKDDQQTEQSVSAVDSELSNIDQGLNDQPDNFQ